MASALGGQASPGFMDENLPQSNDALVMRHQLIVWRQPTSAAST
ncbi:hypothetical protein SynBIOSE41_00681 [Synechococcus sp. BIOS-E4-1]|nr:MULTISPECIES: hypothetical protein [unclassified Synechococcus]QNI53223.1 hypothetical protein SynBIOSE41_00681 [Synechococcus sp. BIOS-E4-1]